MSSKTMRDELRKVLQDLHGYEVPLTGEVTLDADLDYQNKLTSNEIETALTSIINLVDKELPKKIEPTSDEFLAYNHGFNNAIDQVRAKLKGDK